MLPVVVILMIYTLLVGWCLIGRVVEPENGYLLIAIPCLVPAGWYAYGFLRANDDDQDFGLAISAAGWVMLALACFLKFSLKTNEVVLQQDGSFSRVVRPADSPTALVLGIIAVACLLVGAGVSWYAWRREVT